MHAEKDDFDRLEPGCQSGDHVTAAADTEFDHGVQSFIDCPQGSDQEVPRVGLELVDADFQLTQNRPVNLDFDRLFRILVHRPNVYFAFMHGRSMTAPKRGAATSANNSDAS